MKRAFTFLIALVLVFSLSATAFAAADGSITITNATKGDTYRLYKIFESTFIPDADADGKPEAVSYTLTDPTIYSYMFGDPSKVTANAEAGTLSNGYFVYTEETKLITRQETATNAQIFEYLATMVRTLDPDGSKCLAKAENVQNPTVSFTGLDYGYYLIDKAAADGVDVAVTITSNTPSVNVIDKNQKPATEFSKKIWDEDYRGADQETRVDENGNTLTGKWVTVSSANIGDIVNFKVDFTATNYDGEKQVEYYSVMDTKGTELWVEFNKITVKVGDKVLNQGYYHGVAGTHNTGEWDYLGTWTDPEDPQNAEWYLVHYGYDKFEIVIPWMSNHTFTGSTTGYSLTYGTGADSIYDSPVDVVIEYCASVEPDASIGAPAVNNLWNSATLTWNPSSSDFPGTSTTTTTVFALGLHKVDEDNNSVSLAGAQFEIYRDEACTSDPVYVIPTNVKGVYILDDLHTIVSGSFRKTSRDTYKDYLEAYLGPNYATTQKNVVTTEANGKVVILGLEAGDYYLKETKAPDGYNILAKPEKVTIGQTNNTFSIVVDADGNVKDTPHATDGLVKIDYTATPITIENGKGLQLPSTGGAGTMMLITFGIIIDIAFAILLITHKKMSIYHD